MAQSATFSPEREQRTASSPQSVARVIGILETLCAAENPVSLADLSRALKTPKSSLAGLLRGLEEAGLIVPAHGAWQLGGGAFGLGSALVEARRRVQTSDLVRQGMRRLAELTGETVLFAVADPGGETLTYVDVIESRSAVRFAVSPGDRRPLYCTAAGRALLAAMPEADLARYLAELRPVAFTGSTVTDREELAELIATARQAGAAQTVDQAGPGVSGTSAVVRDASGAVLGALSVGAPTSRTGASPFDAVSAVRDEAARISCELGYRPLKPVASRSEPAPLRP